jgi:NAD(P)-dependent dehydrogenase (short-subunit alcohol dehydrogenase family)
METSERKIALVTGAGRAEGIGFEVSRQLGQQGYTVLLTARHLEAAEPLATTLRAENLDVWPYALDVTDEASVRQLAGHVQQQFGRLDVLVNNAAGTSAYGEQSTTADLTQAHAVLETTLFGAWRLTQALLPLIQQSSAGRIVNVSSGAGSHGDPAFGLTTRNGMGTSYAVSKAALNALTAKLAFEASSDTLRINAVCPGFTATFEGGAAMGARPVAEGAASVVWAALIPNAGPTGGFFRDGKPLPW